MQRGCVRLLRCEQQELFALGGVLGEGGVDEGVPAATDRQARELGGPGADGVRGNDTALKAAGQGRPLGAGDEVGDVRRLLEQGGPDGLEGGLGADH